MTQMTANGVTTTNTPGQEQYETFTHNRKKYVQYDYRDFDNKLFTTTAPNLEAARVKRDKWLKEKAAKILKQREEEDNKLRDAMATRWEEDNKLLNDNGYIWFQCESPGDPVIHWMLASPNDQVVTAEEALNQIKNK